MSIDWDKLDMERQIEKARDDSYYAEKRLRENMKAAREDAESAYEYHQNQIDSLTDRISALEKTVLELTAIVAGKPPATQ